MTTRWVPGLLLLSLSLAPCRAATLYVDQRAHGPAVDGSSWACAFPIVQQALDAAESGDEVWVAAGTYSETVTLKSGVGLYGGFAGTETNREQRDWEANPTALDGQHKGTVVTIAPHATSQTVVDGFTICNGAASLVGEIATAGGIYVQSGSPIVSHNVITACVAVGSGTSVSLGGGIYVASGMPLIAGNTITGNAASVGGGICASGGLIRDNVIANNSASHPTFVDGAGGGVCAWSPTVVVVHNLVEGNEAWDEYGGGGGLHGNPIVLNNVFRDNKGVHAAAMRCYFNSTVIRNAITNADSSGVLDDVWFDAGVFASNLLAGNTGPIGLSLGRSAAGNYDGTEPVIVGNTIVHAGPGGTYTAIDCEYHSGEKPIFSNNIIRGWSKAATFYAGGTAPAFTTDHNDVYGNTDNALALPGASQAGESGNISADPLFVDAANGDFRLQAGSPCIDAGNDAYVASGDRDLLGAPRIAGAHVDIGCYEYGSPAWTMLDAAEVLKVAAGLSLATPADVSRLDVIGPGSPGLTVADATLIARWLLN